VVKGLAKYETAYAMSCGTSVLTQATSSEERLLPSDTEILSEAPDQSFRELACSNFAGKAIYSG